MTVNGAINRGFGRGGKGCVMRLRAVRGLVLVIVLMFTALMVPSAVASGHRPVVLPPNAKPRGVGLAEWSARWWQWAFSTPNTSQGPFVEGRMDCGVNQPQRRVWFLAGPFNESGSVSRQCVVPRKTILILPVLNVECSNREDPPFFGDSPAARRKCVHATLFKFADLSLVVDGKKVRNLRLFTVTSPDFEFVGVPGNPVGIEGPGQATGRGVYAMLRPLAPGKHVVSFAGTFPAFPFTASATYRLTVPRR